MKICFISNLYPPDIMGGAELYVKKIVQKLAENKENQIIVITANQKFSWQPIVEENENIRIYRLWPPNLYSLTTKRKYNFIFKALWHLIDLWNPFIYFTIKKILKKEKPDLVHTHNLAGLSFSVFSAVKSLGIKTIHTCHDYYLLCPYANLVCPLTGWRFKKIPPFFCQWYRKITQAILKNKVDIVLTPSKFVMEAHLANGFFTTSQQIILPLGVSSTTIATSTSPATSTTFLCISQLAPHKGVDILIKSFQLLLSTYHFLDSKLLVIGSGTEQKNLEKLANNDKKIIFLGQLSPEEVQNKYQEVDIVIIPSLAPETFSLVMFEAMANGKLVIASKIGALTEYIKDEETGLLFEAGNAAQLKEILEKVINNTDIVKKIGQNAQQFAQEFTFQKHWEKLKGIYLN